MRRLFRLRMSGGRAEIPAVAKAYEQFEARAFHSDLSHEALDGMLCFTVNSFRFDGGETVIDIPVQRLNARLDEPGESVILQDSAQPEWSIVTSDLDLLECDSVPALTALSAELESRATRRELTRRVKMVVFFFVGAGVALWLGMLAVGAMVRAIVARVPAAMEQEVGTNLLAQFEDELGFSDDTNQVARLTAMAQPLLQVLPANQQWQFYIVEEPSPNAFALPGGHIVVTTGLLELSERAEEVLGVVAHEVAHVTKKHGFRHAIASAGPFLVFQVFLGSGSDTLAAVAGGSAVLIDASFSQEYEKEADDVGWEYLTSANIDPRGMIDMFYKLKVAEAAEGMADDMPKAFQSHPDLDKRIARLEKKWKRLARKSGFVQLNDEPKREL
jgi:Zn-dependent protease with chaperone function